MHVKTFQVNQDVLYSVRYINKIQQTQVQNMFKTTNQLIIFPPQFNLINIFLNFIFLLLYRLNILFSKSERLFKY